MEYYRKIKTSDRLPANENYVVDNQMRQVWYAQNDGGTNGVKKGNWYHNNAAGYEIKVTVEWWLEETEEQPEVSDADIDKAALDHFFDVIKLSPNINADESKNDFTMGAKWMQKQLNKQNHGDK